MGLSSCRVFERRAGTDVFVSKGKQRSATQRRGEERPSRIDPLCWRATKVTNRAWGKDGTSFAPLKDASTSSPEPSFVYTVPLTQYVPNVTVLI